MRLTITRRAFADIADIAEFGAETWGEERARVYTDALLEKLNGLALFPHMGVQDEYQKDFRRIAIGRHVAFYQVGVSDILVVRVLHMSQDPSLHLS